jgi:hypothetical protein
VIRSSKHHPPRPLLVARLSLLACVVVGCGGCLLPKLSVRKAADAGPSRSSSAEQPVSSTPAANGGPTAEGGTSARGSRTPSGASGAADADGAQAGSFEMADAQAHEAANPSAPSDEPGTGGEPAGGSGADRAMAQTTPGCTSAMLMCGSNCVANDAKNCGMCGHDCGALPHVAGAVTCDDGRCTLSAAACATGWMHCSSDSESGCETDLSQPATCGGCTNACPEDHPICDPMQGCVSGCPGTAATMCGKSCVDVKSDAKHCGSCDKDCAVSGPHASPTCSDGSCDFSCVNGYTRCGSSCVDLTSDSDNCGTCGRTCGDGRSCVSGNCACHSGTHDCSGTCASDDSPQTCGISCSPCRSSGPHSVAACEAGSCQFTCQSGYEKCTDGCVDLDSDGSNCGSCNNACGAGQSCVQGQCTCASGSHLCSGRCVSNTSTSSCGDKCAACPGVEGGSATCDGTTCGLQCVTTRTMCSGACVYIDYDSKNCGSCGHACPTGATCAAGICNVPN